jgi:hypothetical protein
MPPFDQSPDQPQSFGSKVSWFALKASEPASVVATLGLVEAIPSNWASGLAAVHSDRTAPDGDSWLFISPPVRGRLLAVSASWPYPTIESYHDIGRKFEFVFSRLIRRFDDVQFFGSHRVVDFVSWARAPHGKPMRIFTYADGEVLTNIGAQTREEAKLGFPNLSGLSPSEATAKIVATAQEDGVALDPIGAGRRKEALAIARPNGRGAFPRGADVTDLAGLWSVDPTQVLNQDTPSEVGLATRLPKIFTQ